MGEVVHRWRHNAFNCFCWLVGFLLKEGVVFCSLVLVVPWCLFLVVFLALVVYTRVPCSAVSMTLVHKITLLPIEYIYIYINIYIYIYFYCFCYGFWCHSSCGIFVVKCFVFVILIIFLMDYYYYYLVNSFLCYFRCWR